MEGNTHITLYSLPLRCGQRQKNKKPFDDDDVVLRNAKSPFEPRYPVLNRLSRPSLGHATRAVDNEA
jgi:hypothetical protein